MPDHKTRHRISRVKTVSLGLLWAAALSFAGVASAATTIEFWHSFNKVSGESLGTKNISGIVAPDQFARWGIVMGNDSDLIDSRTGDILLD